MNAIPFVISLLGFMFFLQPTYAQKLLRTEYQVMLTEFPVLSDSLMTDKYRTSFYQVNDCGRWNFYSQGNTKARWRFQGKEKVLDFIIADTTKSSRQYWHYFSNPFAMDADSITFSADVLIGEGNQAQLLLKQIYGLFYQSADCSRVVSEPFGMASATDITNLKNTLMVSL